jgi:hypothetical protein
VAQFIERYLTAMDSASTQLLDIAEAHTSRLKKKIAAFFVFPAFEPNKLLIKRR